MDTPNSEALLRPIRALGAALSLALMLVVSCSDPLPDGESKPRLVGKYVGYTDWGSAPLCETIVDELDEFVERTAVFLEIEPPPEQSITFTWLPRTGEEPLPCSDTIAEGCAQPRGDHVQIYSRIPWHIHEIVHAITALAMPGGTQILGEGLADYLGSRDGAYLTDRAEFSERFNAMLDRGKAGDADDYLLALQFVGALIERDGVKSFRDFWTLVADATSPGLFASAYESVYMETLVDGLAAIEQMEIRPLSETYSTTCQGIPLPWPAQGIATWSLAQEDACLDHFSINHPHPSAFVYNVRYTSTPPHAGAYQFIRPGGPDVEKKNNVHIRKCGDPDTRTWINSDGQVLNLEEDLYVIEVVTLDGDRALSSVELSVVTP